MPVSSRAPHWFLCALGTTLLALPAQLAAQGPPRDTLARAAGDTSHLAPVAVSATRSGVARDRVPNATAVVDHAAIVRGQPTLGLDESLGLVPGVLVANRYNFSLDQRVSIRGFGARSAFGLRGITVLLDGIPQTLPDGQGQLTNVELGEADRIDILRGSSSSLFGNAAGGVISIWSDPVPPRRVSEQVSVTGGAPDGMFDRPWSKWRSTTRWRVGQGVAQVTASRLRYVGERQHSDADLRDFNGHLVLPIDGGWTLTGILDAGVDPRADNPGSLTAAELAANPDSADAIYQSTRAGKSAHQYQGGITLHRYFDGGGEASLTLFALNRELHNPQTFAYIDLGRRAYGARASLSMPLRLAGVPQTITTGFDTQVQRDDRTNFNNTGGDAASPKTLDQLEHVESVGPFVQNALRLGARGTLTLGVRYDRLSFRVHDRLVTATNPDDSGDRLMDATSGSAGLTVRAADAATVYANVGSSFETPTTTELANRPDTAGGFNAALDPQIATNYEVGIRGRLTNAFSYSVAAYQVAVRGELIAFEEPSSPGRSFYRNAGKSRHRGLEIGAHMEAAPGYTIDANYTVSDFRYTHYAVDSRNLDGRLLPGIPPRWLDLVFHTRPWGPRGLWSDIEARHESGYLVDDTLSVTTDPWTTFDVRVGWDGTLAGSTMHPYVAVANLFDRRYVSSVVINAARNRYYEPAPGRTLQFGFSIDVGS